MIFLERGRKDTQRVGECIDTPFAAAYRMKYQECLCMCWNTAQFVFHERIPRTNSRIAVSDGRKNRYSLYVSLIYGEDQSKNGRYCNGQLDRENCTNAEFAKRVGVSLNVITNMTAHGIIPSTRSLIKIADYTNKPFDYILGISDDTDFEKSENPVTFDVRLLELIQENNL